jgi:hypothetical protein
MVDVKILRSCFESPATKIEAINVFLLFLPTTHIMSTSARCVHVTSQIIFTCRVMLDSMRVCWRN